MITEHIRRSETYPKYHLIRRADGLHVALEATPELRVGLEAGDPDCRDGFFSVGQISHEENFETACDNAEEEFRVMLADARAEFGL